MTTTRSAVLALAALGLSASLAACGQAGDTDSSGSQTSSPGTSDSAASSTEAPGGDGTSDDDATSDDGSKMTDGPRATRIPTPGDGAAKTGIPLGPVPESVTSRDDVQAAIAAEAQRSSVQPDAVTVAGYAEVTWPNGAIGCGQDGMMYTQALVPGYLLILEVDGEHLHYHAAQGKPFSYCAQPSPPATIDSSGPPTSDI